MTDDLFLTTSTARELYEERAKGLPIIDYHNHISVSDIVFDRRFGDVAELWLIPDPYKHRLMRISGIDEHFITGDASPREKFKKFCSLFPYLLGNPVYDWALLELRDVFGIEDIPSADNADYIFDKVGEMLKSDEFSAKGILSRFGIEYQSPVASLTDDLSLYRDNLSPSLRGDNLLMPTVELISLLEERSSMKITDTDSYMNAVSRLLDGFSSAGCRFADHALDDGFVFIRDGGRDESIFASCLSGRALSDNDKNALASSLLLRLGSEYSSRGWSLLLHLDAKRKTSDRLARVAGPAGGYAAVGGNLSPSSVADLLSAMENTSGGLPKTVLFPLNMSDMPALSVLEGSFSEDGISAKVELGPAWWWCDHALGMRYGFECISSFGSLCEFIGMTTDSRSLLSFVRHDYFRRIFCSWLAEKYESGAYVTDKKTLGEIVERVSYKNAKRRIKGVSV